jgi:hypothetical protein
MALDIGPVGIWGYGLWQRNDDAAEAVAELDELGYGALWLGSSDGGLELHEALLAASRRPKPGVAYGPAGAGRSRPKMLRLAAARSAGVHPYLVTPAHTKKARDILGPEPLLAPEQKVILETDPVKAREIARETSSLYLAAALKART